MRDCKIILARHGQTEWNKEYRFQGRTNVNLTEEGKKQAHSLSARLLGWKPEVVYTSPLDRALYTAAEIARPHNLEPVIIPELEEINFGTWEGMSIPSLKDEESEIYSKWRNDPFFNMPEGAETWEDISRRLTRAAEIMLEGNYTRIVAVSHGGVMRALYAVMLGLNPHKTWNIEVSNCSVSGIEIAGGQKYLSFLNDYLHVAAGKTGENLPLWGEIYEH